MNRKYLESLPKDKLVDKVLELWEHRSKLIQYTDCLEELLEKEGVIFSRNF